ncbi:hypothetical protein [Roseisolibacter agri]|uniref:Tetratricopeptide repeat protein n=1 Tax=Roseisolibacter agri TaxID=2014610 RepID=A0AA37Q9N4_9BACT|nr:hypothetical protein [Roseisolibacter agri]GLC24891.1 hypothetical protein rosag_14040 [Roseisolibacter agri]
MRTARLLAPLALALLPHAPLGAQPAAAPATDSIVAAATRAQLAGRGDEARAILARGIRGATRADARLLYQGILGDTHLYEGDLKAALRVYGAAAAAATRAKVDSMAGAAHYGMALVEAMSGRAREADAHLAAAERAGDWPGNDPALVRARDRAMLSALLGRVEATDTALRALASTPRAAQFVPAFRGLSLAMAGRCADALRATALAADQQGAIVLAARARCAAASGQAAEASAARTAVLTMAPPDPFGWPHLIARHLARQIR